MSRATKQQPTINSASTRVTIAVNERGASAVTQAIFDLAAVSQTLSPKLAASLRGKALRIGLHMETKVKDVAAAILDTVVHQTPHDTGQARANWQVSVSASSPESEPQFGKLDYDGDETVSEGLALIYTTPRRDGETVWISNGLPYIEALNNGWSQQAPAGFVEMAVQAGAQAAGNRRETS